MYRFVLQKHNSNFGKVFSSNDIMKIFASSSSSFNIDFGIFVSIFFLLYTFVKIISIASFYGMFVNKLFPSSDIIYNLQVFFGL